MRFADPWWLMGLPLLGLAWWWRTRPGPAAAFVYSSTSLFNSITALGGSLPERILAVMRCLALALVIVGLARPQIGEGTAPLKASGVDIVVGFDLSGSMAAEDFELNGKRVNRVEIARDVLEKFIAGRPSDRIGIVAFANQAFIACPLTLDHDFLLTNLRRINLGQVGDGTAIGSALSAGVNRLRSVQKSKSRLMILMTDGQDNSSQVPPLTAAEAAQALGVKVYTIGVGTHGQAPMPVFNRAGQKMGYQMQPVDIDEATLQKISERTGGKYFRADNAVTLRGIYAEIDRLEKTEVEVKRFQSYRELYPWWVLPGAILLVLELLLSNTAWRRLP